MRYVQYRRLSREDIWRGGQDIIRYYKQQIQERVFRQIQEELRNNVNQPLVVTYREVESNNLDCLTIEVGVEFDLVPIRNPIRVHCEPLNHLPYQPPKPPTYKQRWNAYWTKFMNAGEYRG